MKRIFIVLLFMAAATAVVNAQQRRATVSGVVADADTKQNIVGALIGIAPASDSTKLSHIISGAGGTFSMGLNQGEEYNLAVSILGYDTDHRRVEVVSSRMALDTIYLRQGIMIDAVVKEAVALRTSMEGDTLIYNADSYKVAADADISGLLQKMPGIKVESGVVEAQGETVKKVLIDGREFFGEDVNAAISSLPAEIVQSVEVFDKLSDNAEFTGIDDGEGYKALNIRTRESMRQGVMGKLQALYGAEPSDKGDDSWHHYGLVSGNVSVFQGDSKLTVGGTLNNLNQRNFMEDDFLNVGWGNDGVAKVGMFQANYIDKLGKKDQWEINASYSFNHTNSDNTQARETEYFDHSIDFPFQNTYSNSNRRTNNHTLRARIDFKPKAGHELRIRPYLRYQGNKRGSAGEQEYISLDGANIINYLNWSNSTSSGWSTGLDVNYRVRIGNKAGRTLSTQLNAGYNNNDGDSESYSEDIRIGEEQLLTPSYTYGYTLRGGLTYTEPLAKSSLLSLEYNINYQFSDIDRKRYEYDFILGEYPPDYTAAGSGIYNSKRLTHSVGPGYRLQKKDITLSAGVYFEASTLKSESVAPQRDPIENDYYNPTYMLMLNAKFNKNASLRLFFNSNTSSPSVTNLQDVLFKTNTQSITLGNPNLKPTYYHRVHARFILPNVEKGRTFAIHVNGMMAQNYVTNKTLRNANGYVVTDDHGNTETLSATQTFSQPVNLDGYWSVRVGADYGFPLTFMKSNLNLRGGASYQETPSLRDQVAGNGTDLLAYENKSRNFGLNGGVVLGSNINERIDFTVGYNINYSDVKNSNDIFASGDNKYLRHTAFANFKFILPAQFTISGDVSYYNYKGLKGSDLHQEYTILNASVGKKIFRNKLGEINLFCNDILNQNTSFRRQWNADNMSNITNNVIGRYFGIKFIWNIRKFGKNGSQNPAMYENQRRGFPGGGPPMGGRGHGG